MSLETSQYVSLMSPKITDNADKSFKIGFFLFFFELYSFIVTFNRFFKFSSLD